MTEIAIVAIGNFWELEDELQRLPGIVRTRVGYAGGTASDPQYHTKHDHIEAVRIDFNPRQTTFEDVINDALSIPYGAGRTAHIFYIDEPERQGAEAVWRILQTQGQGPANVTIRPLTKFHEAEAYHQQYLSRLRGEYRN